MKIEKKYIKRWLVGTINFWFNLILVNFSVQFLYGCIIAVIFQTFEPYQIMYHNPIENINAATLLTLGIINITYLFSIFICDNISDVYMLDLNKLFNINEYEE